MRSIADAARLLAAADSVSTLGPIAEALGFGAPLALDERMMDTLGLHAGARAALAHGRGSLRALLLRLPDAQTPRDAVARVARQLSARAPHLLWLVGGVHPPTSSVAFACWSDARAPLRVAALLADRRHVLDSDAETLLALAATTPATTPDVLVHARWLELLGRDALTRRFYRTLEATVSAMAESLPARLGIPERRELALLNLSRLLFLAFLETKGWLDGNRGFLTSGFDAAMLAGGGYHRRVLLPLFFGTLNTPYANRAAAARAFGNVPFLNGGLFARTPLERRARGATVSDAALGRVFGDLLRRFRFTAREDSTAWSEAAIDPEMLGKAFESLMSSQDRRATGAFYTPQAIVERVAGGAIATAVVDETIGPDAIASLLGGRATPGDATTVRGRLGRLRVLDPACGSGAFLVHALELIAMLMTRAGDPRPSTEIRRQVLTTSIFGVDVNPTAVWLCELRLWLSMVIDSDAADPRLVPPLPNLDHHIRVGDALSGSLIGTASGGRTLALLRARYARAMGSRKRTLAAALEREERARALSALAPRLEAAAAARRELLAAVRSRDLFGNRDHPPPHAQAALDECRARVRAVRREIRALSSGSALPFSWNAHFADVLGAGGFSVVLGNPPWIRVHRIPPAARAALRDGYVVYRDAAWRAGADAAGAGHAFAGQVDIAALFVERSLALLRAGGTLALLLPSKLWRSLSGGGVRALLNERAQLLAIEDWTLAPAIFDAATYPALLMARRRDPSPDAAMDAAPSVRITEHGADARSTRHWTLPAASIPLDDTRGSPWLLLPARVRAAFDSVTKAGPPLVDSALGRPRLGVKCGCNDAFLVEAQPPCEAPRSDLVAVRSATRTGLIEHELLRPCLRGEHVAAWRPPPATGAHVIWTHAPDGTVLRTLPRYARAWLAPWRRRLARRADARGRTLWWTLFRTEGADVRDSRVVWSDFGRVPRAIVLPAGDPHVPLNTCYVLGCATPADANAFATLLNSSLAAAWLNALAEPARGGYRRYLGWTVARLPIPWDWARARDILAPLGARAMQGAPPDEDVAVDAVLEAYRLTLREIAPLLCDTPTRASSAH